MMRCIHSASLASNLVLILMSCLLISSVAVPIEQVRSIEETSAGTVVTRSPSEQIAKLEDDERCKVDSDCLSAYCHFSGLNGIGRCRQGDSSSFDSAFLLKQSEGNNLEQLEKRQNVTVTTVSL